MEILNMQVFVSLLLVVGSVLLLAYSVKHADYEHADRLTLLPLEDDDARPAVVEHVEVTGAPPTERG